MRYAENMDLGLDLMESFVHFEYATLLDLEQFRDRFPVHLDELVNECLVVTQTCPL